MLLLCYAGLQLEVAKCIVTAAQREEAGCRSYRRASWEANQSRGSPDKWLLRGKVAERRGASAKRLLSEEVAQHRKVTHSSIHPSIHDPSIHPSIHPSFLPSFLSLIHLFIRSFTDSLVHCFIDSLDH